MDEKTLKVKGQCNRLLDFVDIKILKNILDAFTDTTGLMTNIVDINGKSIFSKNDIKKCCKFCRIIYNYEHGLERCQGAYKRAGKQAAIFGEPYIFRCPSGLIEWAAPIIVDGNHLGTIICGQVLMWNPEEFFWIELREMNKDLTNDFTELFQAVQELPIISAKEVKSASYLLYVIANYIMKSGWENFIHVKEFNYQQSLLYDEIQNRKFLEKKLNEQLFFYSIDKESEMMSQLKMGNLDNARKAFQSLITDTIMEGDMNLSHIQVRIIELCTILSRTAVSMGIPLEESTKANTHFFQTILKQNSAKEVTYHAYKILDHYLDLIQKILENPANINVRKIMEYIHENYCKDLTLDSIAEAVYLSSSYASRLFKKVRKQSIMNYLAQVRMEEAKRLLHNPNYLIDTVAVKIGYRDASYFTKVFKRYEGITPTQYRQIV